MQIVNALRSLNLLLTDLGSEKSKKHREECKKRRQAGRLQPMSLLSMLPELKTLSRATEGQ